MHSIFIVVRAYLHILSKSVHKMSRSFPAVFGNGLLLGWQRPVHVDRMLLVGQSVAQILCSVQQNRVRSA